MPQETERAPTIFRMAKDVQELFHGVFKTHEGQEVSTPRVLLRCLGHIAVGTEFPQEETIPDTPDVPPVSAWRVAKSLTKAIWNKDHRQETVNRFKEELTPPDHLGLLAVLQNYRMLREDGFSKEEARIEAWTNYMRLADQG